MGLAGFFIIFMGGAVGVMAAAMHVPHTGKTLDAWSPGPTDTSLANRAEIMAAYMLNAHRAAVHYAHDNPGFTGVVPKAFITRAAMPGKGISEFAIESIEVESRVDVDPGNPGRGRVWTYPTALPPEFTSEMIVGGMKRESEGSQGIGVATGGVIVTHAGNVTVPATIPAGSAVKTTAFVRNG